MDEGREAKGFVDGRTGNECCGWEYRVVCTRGRVRKWIALGNVSLEWKKGVFQESIKTPREKKDWQGRRDKRMGEDRMIRKQGRSVEYLKCVLGYLSLAISEKKWT